MLALGSDTNFRKSYAVDARPVEMVDRQRDRMKDFKPIVAKVVKLVG
jgi:hypothetical protein